MRYPSGLVQIVLFSTDNRGNARDVVTRVGTVTEKSASEKIRIFYERTTLLSTAAETKRVRFQLFFKYPTLQFFICS